MKLSALALPYGSPRRLIEPIKPCGQQGSIHVRRVLQAAIRMMDATFRHAAAFSAATAIRASLDRLIA